MRNIIKSDKTFLIIGIISLILVLLLPNLHDYSSYVKQWSDLLESNNPSSAYGVFYNIFVIFFYLFSKLPKAIFVIFYLISVYFVINYAKNQAIKHKKILLYILIFNPIFWIFGIVYGSNDTFLTGITIIALLAEIKSKGKISGALFAVGSTFKFTPLFILPFLIINKLKINFKILLSFFLFASIIILIGYSFWGVEILNPISFGSFRESKMFSIFRFIRGELQPLSFIEIHNLDSISIWLMIGSWLICFLIYIIWSFDKYLMILLAYSNVLLFYKVIHHQFYLLLLFLTIVIYIMHYKTIIKNKYLIISGILFWTWIFFFTIFYGLTHFLGQYSIIREIIGAPTFLLHLSFNLLLLRHIYKYSKKETL